MADLVISNVRKTFGSTVAVDELNLVVEQGEYIALLGPSGCGKTTTLRIIAGFEEPDRGEVLIKGKDVTRDPPYRRDIGLVFQNYAIFPHMTVAENVAYGLKMRKVPRSEINERVQQALDMVRLGGFGSRYPRQLSGGQQQRVALARVIVFRPSVLLLDEPLSNLDARLRQDMQVELRQLQRTLGLATIHVTHDQEEALTVADRIVVMNAGHIMQEGKPQEIYRNPDNRFVANFIGHCNFLDGELTGHEENSVLFTTTGGLQFKISNQPSVTANSCGQVGIRPENIMLINEGDFPPDGANISKGSVLFEVYLGAHRQVLVELESKEKMLIFQQSDVRLDDMARRYQVNDPIILAWYPEACIFYPN